MNSDQNNATQKNIIDCDNKWNSPRGYQNSRNQKYQKCRAIMKFKSKIIDHNRFRFKFQVRRDLWKCCQHFVVLFIVFYLLSLLSCLDFFQYVMTHELSMSNSQLLFF